MTNLTATLKTVTNVGEDMLIEAKILADLIASSADTIDCSASTVVASAEEIKIVSATSMNTGKSLTPYVTWTASTRKFAFDGGVSSTNVDSAISSDEIRIEFRRESA